jgi:hypothetical protein
MNLYPHFSIRVLFGILVVSLPFVWFVVSGWNCCSLSGSFSYSKVWFNQEGNLRPAGWLEILCENLFFMGFPTDSRAASLPTGRLCEVIPNFVGQV